MARSYGTENKEYREDKATLTVTLSLTVTTTLTLTITPDNNPADNESRATQAFKIYFGTRKDRFSL